MLDLPELLAVVRVQYSVHTVIYSLYNIILRDGIIRPTLRPADRERSETFRARERARQ